MKTIGHLLNCFLLMFGLAVGCVGCGGGGALSLSTIPSDFKLQTTDIGMGGMDMAFQARDIKDYNRGNGQTLIVVQLKYKSDTPLRCYDANGGKVPFVGSLVDVNARGRSALIVRELQIMGDKGLVAYVYSVPQEANTITIAGHGKHDIAAFNSPLPSINAEGMKIRQMVRERN